MHHGVSEICEETAQTRSRVLACRIDRCLSRHKVRQNMSIHEGEKAFKIGSENGPWVSKGQTGESKVEKRIKSGMC